MCTYKAYEGPIDILLVPEEEDGAEEITQTDIDEFFGGENETTVEIPYVC